LKDLLEEFPEEEKVVMEPDVPFVPIIKRRNSRFLSGEEKKGSVGELVKYRPEFGSEKNTTNERIWELMSSYIG